MALQAWRRVVHLEQVVASTLKRDAERRSLRKSDARVSIAGASRRVRFDVRPPLDYRELPATPIALTTLDAHGHDVLRGVIDALAAAGVRSAETPPLPGGDRAVAIRADDWEACLTALGTRLGEQYLVGGSWGPRARARSLFYRPAADADRLTDASTVIVFAPAATFEGDRVVKRYGLETAVRLERWEQGEDGKFHPNLWNPRTGSLDDADFTVPRSDEPEHSAVPVALRTPDLFEVTFPIDVVYTWVDGTDDAWLKRKWATMEGRTAAAWTESAAEDLRFIAHDELRHSLRSVEQYAPWVRHIYIVTDRQRPEWLADHPRVSIVDHREIAPDPSALPTFNSHAIEANLHRIDGLSEHFLYLNDDVFLSSKVGPELFFSPNGLAHMYLSKAQVGEGAPVPGEPASDTAGKNARRLVLEACGRRLSRKLFHAPFALQRSVSYEIEERWPAEVAYTRESRFRRIDDVTLSGALHMNYAYAVGKAEVHSVRYRYVNIGAADAEAQLQRLVADRHSLQTFCLNEADPELDSATIDRLVRAFLRRRFPDRSSFEIPGR